MSTAPSRRRSLRGRPRCRRRGQQADHPNPVDTSSFPPALMARPRAAPLSAFCANDTDASFFFSREVAAGATFSSSSSNPAEPRVGAGSAPADCSAATSPAVAVRSSAVSRWSLSARDGAAARFPRAAPPPGERPSELRQAVPVVPGRGRRSPPTPAARKVLAREAACRSALLSCATGAGGAPCTALAGTSRVGRGADCGADGANDFGEVPREPTSAGLDSAPRRARCRRRPAEWRRR